MVRMRAYTGEDKFRSWIAPLVLLTDLDAPVVRIAVGSKFRRKTVLRDFGEALERELGVRIEFVVLPTA